MMRDNQNLVVIEDTAETLHLVIPEYPVDLVEEYPVEDRSAGCILCEPGP